MRRQLRHVLLISSVRVEEGLMRFFPFKEEKNLQGNTSTKKQKNLQKLERDNFDFFGKELCFSVFLRFI